jgi:RNA polymerase sigma-70 factor, ECF subfamily
MASPSPNLFPPARKVGGCACDRKGVHLSIVKQAHLEHDRGYQIVTDMAQFKKDLVQMLPRLRRFALTLTHNREDGDDLVQTACERAILRLSQWQPGTRIDSWIYTMMRNLWVSELRSRRVRVGRGQVDAAETDELSSSISAHDHVYGNQVVDMVMSLSDGLSSTLLLVAVEGHSYQETAEILDIPIGTVMSRMSRARQMMKEKLASTGELVLQ